MGQDRRPAGRAARTAPSGTALEGDGGEPGATAGVGSGGGTSCDQADTPDIQTTNDERRAMRTVMVRDYNKFAPARKGQF